LKNQLIKQVEECDAKELSVQLEKRARVADVEMKHTYRGIIVSILDKLKVFN
jgi:hypothetical protein